MYIHRHKGEEVCNRWVKGVVEVPPQIKCSFDGCDQVSERCLKTENSTILNLCNMHYQQEYRRSYHIPCASCEQKPEWGQHFQRKCPDPVYITAYMRETENFKGTITDESKICTNCYVKHKKIMSEREISLGEKLSIACQEFISVDKVATESEYFDGIGNLVAFDV
jgi:hypothetical protein